MPHIEGVVPGSIADEGGVAPGDELVSINGSRIDDIFDYLFNVNANSIEMLIRSHNGGEWILEAEKDEDEDPGLLFGDALLGKTKECVNKCIFCFVDQLPRGLRESLYVKDDDIRMTFTNGNYVTLTNVSQGELERIVRYRLSPVNVSVHTTDAALRAIMLGRRGAACGRYDILQKIKYLTESGISVNAQIVLCKRYNDGHSLDKTLADLGALNEYLSSVSVVPSGLTRFRDNLPILDAFGAQDADTVLRQIAAWQKKFLGERGTRLVFAADEFYTLCGKQIPGHRVYEGFPQLDNGVGMLALFRKQFSDGLAQLRRRLAKERPYYTASITEATAELPCAVTPACANEPIPQTINIICDHESTPQTTYIITGESSAAMIGQCVNKLVNLIPALRIAVIPAENAFFGGFITVTGLLAGRDILNCIKNTKMHKNSRILISKTMLRHGTDVFLDDYSLEKLRNEAEMDIMAVENDGRALIRALTNGHIY